MKLSVVDINGKKQEDQNFTSLERPVDAGVMHANYLLERYQRAAARQGSSSTKTKAEVSGGGCKPYRQKGTGHARRGSNRTPLRPGGGIVFGPKPRDFSFKMNRKVIKLSIKSILTAKQDKLRILKVAEDQLLKTSQMANFLKVNKIESGKKALFLLDFNEDLNLERAVRNLANVKIASPHYIPISVAADADLIVVSVAAYAILQEKVLS
jgi:large subunit ribosomal protein L4